MRRLFQKTFTFSLACHLFCFIVIGFSIPKVNSKNYELMFLGSFLSDIDFLNSKDFNSYAKVTGAVRLDEFFIKKANIKQDKVYLISKITKPVVISKILDKNIFLVNSKKSAIINNENKGSSLIYEKSVKDNFLLLKDNSSFSSTMVKLEIDRDGRVEFVERLESSGNLELDLLAKRQCLDYIFSPSFSKESLIKTINLRSFSNAKN